MIDRITLLGSASGRNAGDAALLSSIMDSIDTACGENLTYEIPTINPAFVRRTYSPNTVPINILPWTLSLKLFGLTTYRSILRSDYSLVFDATLFDRSLYNPMFNFLSSFYALFPPAKRRGKRFGCFTVTVGPIRTRRGQEMLREVAELMEFMTVRDEESVAALEEAGVKNPNILITGDAALNTRPADSVRVDELWSSFGLPEGEDVLAINVNPYFDSWTGLNRERLTRENFVRIYSEALNRVAREFGMPLLFVSTQHMDEVLTKEIMDRVQAPRGMALISNRVVNHHDIKGVMSRVSLLFAMRLHCLILTSSALTPVSSLSYLPKVDSFMRSLGLSDVNMSFECYDVDSLAAHLRTSWLKRGSIRARLLEKMPSMQRQALKAGELMAAIRRGESASAALAQLRKDADAAESAMSASRRSVG